MTNDYEIQKAKNEERLAKDTSNSEKSKLE